MEFEHTAANAYCRERELIVLFSIAIISHRYYICTFYGKIVNRLLMNVPGRGGESQAGGRGVGGGSSESQETLVEMMRHHNSEKRLPTFTVEFSHRLTARNTITS